MSHEGSVLFICIAVVLCSMAGCTAVESMYGNGRRAPSAEVACARQWWNNDFCRNLSKRAAP